MWRRLKWLYQRLTRGWDDRETWSLDHTFAEWVVPRLQHLKTSKHGVPISCFANQDKVWDHTDEGHQAAQKVWDDILDTMIAGFTTKIHQWDDHDDIWYTPGGPPEYAKAKELFVKHLDDLWD